MTFDKRLRELRKQRNLTQLQLADAISVNKQTISQYERGVRRPDFDTLDLLCDFFNVSSDYMLGKDDVTMRLIDSETLAIVDSLTDEEMNLISDFRKLNHAGRSRALQTVNEFTELQKYEKRLRVIGSDDYVIYTEPV